MSNPLPCKAEVICATQRWLERAVIGLNLCPFAKSVHVKGLIRYVVSAAQCDEALLEDLESELSFLAGADPEAVDTTLLVVPNVLTRFEDFLDFLDLVDVVLRTYGLVGTLQVASFHPDYVFSDTAPDDIANYTNRAPYPTLHLIRESSLAKATAVFPDAAEIYERNIATLQSLGRAGWRALGLNVNAGRNSES